ncbi:MAG: glycosyl hydrolase family 28-related protein [Bacteroidales bacterium]|nr:glycosyl hydrolase family 28-related protein [Bacteroidales bacterium]
MEIDYMMRKILYQKWICALALVLISFPLFSQNPNSDTGSSPKLFQVTTAETRPGDAVLIRGEYLDKISGIQVCRLTDDNVDKLLPNYVPLPKEDALPDQDGTDRKVTALMDKKASEVNMLQKNVQSVKFIVPKTLTEGIFCVRLLSANNQLSDFYLNVPKVNWAISEEGLKAVTGDYLRIQGKNLLRKGATGQVVLISENRKETVRVKVAKAFDDYSVSVNIPNNVPVGKYHLYYHNGFGGKTAWSEPLKIEIVNKSTNVWDKRTFNVKDFGAKGDGINNETAAFRAALDAAEQNGGGTVYVPRGRYMLTGDIILPPYTMLKGESKELTQIFWNPLNWDTGELPRSLISGTHHFAVKDLHLWASRAWGFIMLNGPVEEQGHITLENLIVRQTALLSGMVYQVKANRDVVDAELNSKWTQTGIILRGENIKVRNCDFNSSGMYTFFAASGFIQNCKFERNGTGVNQPYMLVHPKGLIFEDCYKHPDGYGYAASIDESRNMYEARNVVPFNYTNDREVMTLDGGSGAYTGAIQKISGKTLTLPKGAQMNQWTPNKWNGGGVFIIEGKGTGQYRRIASHTMDVIELDQPFLVDPDASSVISITTVRKNLFFINNEATDCGAYQFYGSAQNGVVSGLKMRRTNGLISRGSLLYRGKQPNWYIDLVNCEFREGNYSHWFGIDDRGHSGFQNINLIGTGGAGLNIGTLIRRNKLYDFTYIRTSPGANANAVTDVIIEDNSITTAKRGIFLGGMASHTSNVLIHNNHYRDVDKQVEINTGLNPASNLILEDGVTPVVDSEK